MRKRKGVYWKWVSTGPYETDVLVVLGGDTCNATEIFRTEMEKAGFELPPFPEAMIDDTTTNGRFFNFHGIRDCGIWFPKIPDNVREIGTVAHESVHVANHTLARCGVHYSVEGMEGAESPNDEPWAYFVGFLVRSILSFANEVRADLTKKKPATKKS